MALGDLMKMAEGSATGERYVATKDIKVGDTVSIIENNVKQTWTVKKVKEDANGLGLWAENIRGDGRWLFDSKYLVVPNQQKEYIKEIARRAQSVIDSDGVEHKGVMTVVISKQDWDEWVEAGRPEMICGVYAKSIVGPGVYFLYGSDYVTGYDVWKPVAKLCSKHGECIMTREHVRETDILKDVAFIVYKNGAIAEDITLTKEIRRNDLNILFKSGVVIPPECGAGYEVVLYYTCTDKSYIVSISNTTSDVDSEWYCFRIHDKLVSSSILCDKDLCSDYWDKTLTARSNGGDLSVDEYLADNANVVWLI